MTRAYGTKPLIIKGSYILLFALGVAFFLNLAQGMENPLAQMLCLIPVGLAILSLVLINAQGVTALTSERDTGALDLLLVTELTPKEFIYGKLYGILYNSKEMIALPISGRDFLWWSDWLTGENLVFFLIDYLLLLPLLGHARPALRDHLHQQPDGRRQQPGHDLLSDGRHPALCVPDRPERPRVRPATAQLPDLHRRRQRGALRLARGQEPVAAIALVSLLTPFWTFYCIISLINGDMMAAFLFSAGIYGFALLAMLVPAVSDFDIALGGRTRSRDNKLIS